MKQILTLSFAAALARSACLDSSVLTSLGFSSTQALAVVSGPTVCTDLFATSGTCVPQAAVSAKFESDNSAFSARASVYGDLTSSLDSLASIVGNTSASAKASVQAISANATANADACVTAWSTLQQGITCILASGAASNFTSSVNGTSTNSTATLTVNVNTAAVGPYLQSCMAYYDSLCLLTAGVSISSNVTVTDSTFLKSQSTLGTPCATLKSNYNCTTTACQTTIYNTLINNFYAPYDYTLFPDVSVFTEISTKIKGLGASISTWFKSTFDRKLATSPNVKTNSSSSGADAKTNGSNSGGKKVTSSAGLVGAMMMLLAAFVAY